MSPTIDPSKLKVTELREELQARGLDTKGNKPVLVKRLKKALEDECKGDTNNEANLDSSVEEFDTSSQTNDTSRVEDADSTHLEESETTTVENTTATESENVQESRENDSKPIEDVEPKEDVGTTENTAEDHDSVNGNECEEQQMETNENVEEKQDQNAEEKDEQHLGSAMNQDVNEDVDAKQQDEDVEMSEQQEAKGEKRKHSSESPERSQKRREVSPIREEEPEINPEKVLLSWYDSDLHLIIDKKNFNSAKPIHDGLFGYAWAGARATHGIATGKARYEVKITGELRWEDFTNQRKERQERARERREREAERQQEQKKKDEAEADKKADENCDENMDKSIKLEESDEVKNENETQDESTTTEEVKEEVKKEVKEELKNEDNDAKTETEEVPNNSENQESCKTEVEKTEMDQTTTENNETAPTTTSTEPKEKEPEKILTHLFRLGWSLPKTSLQLGEDLNSFAYESTGKFVNNKEFNGFATSYNLGDVIGAFLNISEENIEMRFTVNGTLQPETKVIPRSELPENFTLFPHVLSRNFTFEVNFGDKEEPWHPCPEELNDYPFIQEVTERVQGPTTPSERKECEMMLMVGLPGSGKTHWVRNYLKENPDKQMTVIGCSHLLDKMTVHGQPLKSNYNGRWSFLIDKLQRCLNRLTDIAQQRRRNYIIDQTNVFPSAQRRKLRSFEGFKRCAVVVVVGDEEQAKRQSQSETMREQTSTMDGSNDAPDHAILEMKANMSLPSKGDQLEDVIYAELDEEEAKAQVAKYNAEGKAAGYQPGQRKQHQGAGYNRDDRNRWNYRRNDYGAGYRDRGYQRYDRGPRGWGPPPPGPPPGRFMRRHPYPAPPMMRSGGGSRDWMRNNRGPRDRDNNRSYGRNRSALDNNGRSGGSWSSSPGNYGQGNWNQQSGNWGSGGGGSWGGYQQGGGSGGNNSWNSSQWKYGGGGSESQPSGYNQSGSGGYGNQNWGNYYGQYAQQNWGQGQGGTSQSGSNQYNYAQWAQYAQQYAQGQNAKHGSNTVQTAKK